MKKLQFLIIVGSFLLPLRTTAQAVFVERFDELGANVPGRESGVLYSGVNAYHTSFDCSGTVALELEAVEENIVYVPIFPGSPINTLAMSFTTHPSNTTLNGYLDVGYLFDRMDPYTFVTMETYSCTDSVFLSNCSVEKYISYDSAPSYADGIAFRYRPAPGSSDSWFLDNIQVFSPTGCPIPSSISINSITTNSAVMNVAMGASTIGYVIYDFDEMWYIDTGYTNTYTFNSLEPSTTYNYLIYPLCTSGIGGQGIFVSFTTECAVTPIPYHEDFNNCLDNGSMPLCWHAPLPSTNTCGVARSGDYETFGNVLVSDNTSDLIVLPALSLGSETGVLRVSFMYVGGQQNDSVRVGIITDVTDPSTFTEFAAVRQDSTSDYTNDLRTHYTYVTTSSLSDTFNIALWCYGSARFDEIDVRLVDQSCNMPESASITVRNDTITLCWQNPDNSTTQNYRVLYSTNYIWPGLPGHTDSDTATVFVSQDTSLTLIGLTPRTIYYFWVQPECSDSSDWLFIGYTEALCPTGYDAPYYLDFTSGYPTLAIPECWNVLSTDALYSRPLIYNREFGGNLEFLGSNGASPNFIALPYIRLQSNNMMITILANTDADAGYLEVGYITDPTDMSGFVVLDSIHSEQTREFDIYTSSVPDSLDTIYIAFRYNARRHARIFTILIDEIPNCIRPFGITLDTAGHNFATLTIDGDPTTLYEVRYSNYNNVDSARSIIVSSPTFTIDSLQVLTTYYTWVRSLCGSVYNYSNWTAGLPFTTTCGPDPCPINIELYDPNSPILISLMMGCGVNVYYDDTNLLCKIGNTEVETNSYDETIWVCPDMAPIKLNVDGGEYGAFGGWMFWMGIHVTLADSTTYYYDATQYPHGTTFLTLDHPCPTCSPVQNIAIDSIATDLVAISWTPADTTDTLFYIYLDNLLIDSVSAANNYTFTGLNPNYGYSFGVATNCSGTSSSIITYDTSTLCNQYEPCPIRVTLNDVNGTGWIFNNHVQVWSNNYIVADVSSNASGSTTLNNDVYVCSGDSVRIVWSGVGNSAIIWSDMYFITNIYNGDGSLMGSDTANANTPDHGIVTFMPTCPCLSPDTSYAVVGINSVTAYWLYSDSTEVQISNDEYYSTPITLFTNQQYATFNELAPNSVYYIRLRTICPIGDRTSEWSELVVTTLEDTTNIGDTTIVIPPQPCSAPDSLTLVSTTYTTATVSWHPTGNEEQWEVNVNVQGDIRLYLTTDTVFVIDSLYPEILNRVCVRAVCGEDNEEAPWSDTLEFMTDICPPIPEVSIGIGQTTTHSAMVSWQQMENSLGYKLYYGEQGFYISEADSAMLPQEDPSYTMEGLETETDYELFILNKCTETLYSAPTQRVSFRTLAETGIASVNASALMVSPNPASRMVNVSILENGQDYSVEVVDMTGRTVQSFAVAGNQCTIDVTEMAQGAYFIRVTGEKFNAVRKLVVK